MMNNIKNNRLIWIVLLMWLCFLAPAHADSKKEGIDVQDIVFSHIQDAYTWHITEWNGKEIAISLPILVKSEERGWDMFLSHHLHHGQAHHNYYIATEGEHAGKVVEKNSRGEEVRPVDLSLTKNVCGLFLSCGILLFVVLRTAHWYKRHPNQVPRVYRPDGNDYFLHTGRCHQGVDRQRRVQAVFLLSADGLLLYPDQQSDRNHPGLSGRGQHHRQHCGHGRLGGMYVYRCQPVCDKGILERDILAQSADLPETAVTDHALCRVFRRIHQAVRPDDPSVCQYHGRTYDHPRPHLPDLYHGIDGVVGEFRNDDRFGAVLRVHELSGIAGGLSASIYIHIIVSQLYRFG